ncbi:MAG: hypothetical protein Q4B75_07380 [Eubacteriales bacterium]|nr:hypothetical protein [Eubacteriales bacterium]
MKRGNVKKTIQNEITYSHKYSEKKIASVKKISLILILLMTCLFVMLGTYPCGTMSDIAMMLIWIVYAIPLFFCWMGYFKFVKIQGEISADQYKKGIVRLNNSGMGVLLFSGFNFFCCIHYLITGEYESLAVEVGFFVRVTILFAVSVCFALIQRKQHLNVVANEISEEACKEEAGKNEVEEK